MNELPFDPSALFTVETLGMVARAGFLLIAGFLAAKLVSRSATRLLESRVDEQRLVLLRRASFYGVLGIFLVTALHQLGFNLGVLLGAAGVLSVAIGFASQTSASNIISGLFLIAEQPFGVGDVINVGNTTGQVISIDLLSVKLRTFDNLFVRVPNETLIKTEVKTLTKFPIRRLDLQIGVAYKEDLGRVREVLLEIADLNPMSLDEPKPILIFQGFGESSMNVQFSLWATRENFLNLRNEISEQVKGAFDAAGIEIPFPHRTLYAGSETEPLPIRLVPDPSDPASTPQPAAAG